MKKVLPLIALAILFRPVFPLADYLLNYRYIKTELCVNRDKPILGCDGKCYLKKELAVASEKEKPISSDKKSPSVEKHDLFFFTWEKPELRIARILSQPRFTFAEAHYSPPAMPGFTHPPAIVS